MNSTVQAVAFIFCAVLGAVSPYSYERCPQKECEGGKVCSDGECVDPCPLKECKKGKICTGGKCVDSCPAPKIFSFCSSICYDTCENLNDEKSLICPTVCDPDQCICPPGYVSKGKDRTCVKPSECPCYNVRCRKNEKCIDGKCECVKGYRKNRRGICEKICPFPKIYDPCSTACPKTCENLNPVICTEQCRLDDCVCPDGLVEKSSTDSTCVKPKECKKLCPKPCPSLKECKDGKCVCKEGYSADENNKCYDNCIFMRCHFCKGGKCWPPICGEGLVRRADGSCAKTCSKGKIYQKCPTYCPKTCDNPNPKHCGNGCREIKCVCPKGFYERSHQDHTCVRIRNCFRTQI